MASVRKLLVDSIREWKKYSSDEKTIDEIVNILKRDNALTFSEIEQLNYLFDKLNLKKEK